MGGVSSCEDVEFPNFTAHPNQAGFGKSKDGKVTWDVGSAVMGNQG